MNLRRLLRKVCISKMIAYKRSIVFPVVMALVLGMIGIAVLLQSEPALGTGLVCLLVATLSAVYAYILQKQGQVFVLTADGLEYQDKINSPSQHFSLEEVAEVRYLVRPVYREYQSKKLRLIGHTGVLLAEVNLNALAGADFNEIYHFIEEVAPQVQWDFPQ